MPARGCDVYVTIHGDVIGSQMLAPGGTFDFDSEARANLQTALRLFLEEAARIGTLKEILSEAGYDVDNTVMLSPVIDVGHGEFVLAEEVARCLG